MVKSSLSEMFSAGQLFVTRQEETLAFALWKLGCIKRLMKYMRQESSPQVPYVDAFLDAGVEDTLYEALVRLKMGPMLWGKEDEEPIDPNQKFEPCKQKDSLERFDNAKDIRCLVKNYVQRVIWRWEDAPYVSKKDVGMLDRFVDKFFASGAVECIAKAAAEAEMALLEHYPFPDDSDSF